MGGKKAIDEVKIGAKIWRAMLAAILVVAVSAGASAQIDARALMNAQRNQQRGLDANGMPLDPS